MYGFDLTFLLATFGAAVIRVVTTTSLTVWQRLISFGTALFVGIVFADSAVDILNLDPQTYKSPMGVLLALTGEGLTRWLIGSSKSPTAAISELLKIFGGKK